MWRARWILLVVGVLLLNGRSGWAETRPIEQLPDDVFRWSTLWTDIPKEMADVGKHQGALAGVTWGPTKGTVKILEDTTREIWGVLKEDDRQPKLQGRGHPKGVIFEYTF